MSEKSNTDKENIKKETTNKKGVSKMMYFTTPIYYVNDNPHLGHAFTTINVDFLTRFYKSLGNDVYFLTGTDEHGAKLEKAAKVVNKSPRDFADSIVPGFYNAWKRFNINYDHFIRTTDKEHEANVQKWFQKLYDQGDIYKGKYTGKYCVDCEGYFGDDELLPGDLCPYHKKPVTIMEEESYFFKLSKYESYIKELYAKKDFVYPEKFKGEAVQKFSQGLKDVSISRVSLDWGVQVPFDKEHVIWVWFDALINYMSGLEGKEQYWPAIHVIGKEIFWFHTILWPAMLKGMGYDAPRFFVHGFWNSNGNKMSKSLGNFVTTDMLAKYGIDEGRYFVLRQMPYGEDSDFNAKMFEERYLELSNNVGNLINRIAIIAQKNYIDLTKEYSIEASIQKEIDETIKEVKENLDCFKVQGALQRIMQFAQFLNKYTNDKEPWKLVKVDKEKASLVVANLVIGINILTLLLEPVMPEKMKDARKIFDFKAEKIIDIYTLSTKKIKQEKVMNIEPKILFPQVMKFEF